MVCDLQNCSQNFFVKFGLSANESFPRIDDFRPDKVPIKPPFPQLCEYQEELLTCTNELPDECVELDNYQTIGNNSNAEAATWLRDRFGFVHFCRLHLNTSNDGTCFNDSAIAIDQCLGSINAFSCEHFVQQISICVNGTAECPEAKGSGCEYAAQVFKMHKNGNYWLHDCKAGCQDNNFIAL